MYRQHIENKKLLSNYEDTVFFSDMESDIVIDGKPNWIHAHVDYYKLLDEQYPNSKFILNTRNTEDWIKSRCNFLMSPNGRKNEYIEYTKLVHNTDTETVIDLWRNQWKTHHIDVLEYFKDRPKDLLVYDIDVDTTDKIIDFFKNDLILPKKSLQKLNSGK
jgi:hypothetical protein